MVPSCATSGLIHNMTVTLCVPWIPIAGVQLTLMKDALGPRSLENIGLPESPAGVKRGSKEMTDSVEGILLEPRSFSPVAVLKGKIATGWGMKGWSCFAKLWSVRKKNHSAIASDNTNYGWIYPFDIKHKRVCCTLSSKLKGYCQRIQWHFWSKCNNHLVFHQDQSGYLFRRNTYSTRQILDSNDKSCNYGKQECLIWCKSTSSWKTSQTRVSYVFPIIDPSVGRNWTIFGIPVVDKGL